MRQYPNLTVMLAKETTSKYPRFAAREIENTLTAKHPGAEALVLFKAGPGSWRVVPVGSSEPLRSTAQASRSKVDGRYPAAYCPAPNGHAPPSSKETPSSDSLTADS